MERRSVTYNVLIKMPSYYMAKTSVEKDNGSIVKIKVEGSEEQCNKIFYVYSVMKEKSFIKRYNLYVEDINQKGYFTYDGNYFYPDGKVISKKNEEYSINSNPTR